MIDIDGIEQSISNTVKAAQIARFVPTASVTDALALIAEIRTLRAQVATARDTALEEAATVAEDLAPVTQDMADTVIAERCDLIAEKIRALKTGCPPHKEEMSAAAHDVLAERRRQTDAEGWSPEHDDTHTRGEMARAAACYAWASALRDSVRETITWGDAVIFRRLWPWSPNWWKPKDLRRDLVRAGALIIAEIERLDRAEALKTKEPAR